MTYITNDCLALFIYKHKNQEYESPLIGSLFESDAQYLKFCENYKKYIKLTPRFGQAKLPVTVMNYDHPLIMFLGDIEIHFPHEESEEELMSKWNRRMERLTPPTFIWSDMQMFNGYREDFKKRFKKIPGSKFVEKDEIPPYKDKSLSEIGNGKLQIPVWFEYTIMAKYI